VLGRKSQFAMRDGTGRKPRNQQGVNKSRTLPLARCIGGGNDCWRIK